MIDSKTTYLLNFKSNIVDPIILKVASQTNGENLSLNEKQMLQF